MPEVAGVDVGKDVAPPQRRVSEVGGEVLCVLVRLDHVVDAQPVDVDARAGLKGPGGHLACDLGHRVAVFGDRRVLFVHGEVGGTPLALGEADAVRGL